MATDELAAKLRDLDLLVDAGKITMLDYNERRAELIKASTAPAAGVSAPPPDPLAELSALVDAGKITMLEYNTRRAELLKSGDASKHEAPAAPAAEPPKPAWGAATQKAQVKHWSEGARGDDPTVRKVYAPLAKGVGDGKSFFFLFGLRPASANDMRFLEIELKHIDDDIEALRRAGYTVVLDPQATGRDLVEAVSGKGEGATDLAPAGVYWSAHGGPDGTLLCCDGSELAPGDLDPKNAHPSLRLVIFGSCYVGSRARTWRTALGGRPLVVGWGRPVTIDRVEQFLDPDPECQTGLGDLLARYILGDTPIPEQAPARMSPLTDLAQQGRVGNLPERIRAVADKLGARWREREHWVDVEVPLEDGSRKVAEVFVIDSGEPFSEGEPLLAVEADVGEWSGVVEPQLLFGAQAAPGYTRVSLVRSDTDVPRIVTQGFLPLVRVRDQDLAALVYQVSVAAAQLAKRIFG